MTRCAAPSWGARMRAYLSALALALACGPALAQEQVFTCAFTRECIDETCEDTSFSGVLRSNPETRHGHWQDATRTVELASNLSSGQLIAGTMQDEALLITRAPDGAARFTVHNFAPFMAITYSGTCKEGA